MEMLAILHEALLAQDAAEQIHSTSRAVNNPDPM